MLRKIIERILGDQNEKYLRTLQPTVARINELEATYQALSEDALKAKTDEFRTRVANGEPLDALLPEAFAVLKNACRRLAGLTYTLSGIDQTWNMVPYDVQLIGGIALHQGNIAEMKTGEGKTLVCTLPVYLNAIASKGVHVITVNDYLARRDAEWMGILYRYLGLTVGVIYHDMPIQERQAAYAADITYGTNNEFGFDYLKDNMVTDPARAVQRELSFGIVDEVDSILIDEARTPLIISAPAEESTSKYQQYAQLIPRLTPHEDFAVDEKMRTATLTEAGIKKMEEWLGLTNIYTEAGFVEVHHIEQALRAHACYMIDRDYVVKEGEVIIVDEFTGRLMPGRRYAEGLHQAIEAKQGVAVKRESKTLATITFQNYFRLYQKLAGMTGTASTEAEEFERIYRLRTVVIPTNVVIARVDLPDRVYKNERGKFSAVADEIQRLHSIGQPVLVGTISIEKSEKLSDLLKKRGVPHRVLNAKQHEREAEIIALAGHVGAVTIATNMAGRGTDIKLGEGATDAGGLHILGTERHESRRIDNQLRGRSGRQGDPGSSQFYVSMEDDLMRLFGSDRVKSIMDRLGIPEDQPIENSIISRSIESAQKRVEGYNFDVRKHVLEYDDVMNKHRGIIYSKRRAMLIAENVHEEIVKLIGDEIAAIVMGHLGADGILDQTVVKESMHALHELATDPLATLSPAQRSNPAAVSEHYQRAMIAAYESKVATAPSPEIAHRAERMLYLRAIDELWIQHLDNMKHIRESVSLRGYGQRDPLQEYKQEAYIAFQRLLATIRTNTVTALFRISAQVEVASQLQRRMPIRMVTNEAQMEGQTGGAIQSQRVARTSSASGGTPPPSMMAAQSPQQPTPVINADTIERNAPCPCGSGKKYKKCHGA